MNFNEVEKILVLQLKGLGVSLDGFQNLLEKENFYLSCVFCLKRLLPKKETENIPGQLRTGIGSWKKQIQQCKMVSEVVKNKLNYRSELTFDNFLYPTEFVARSLFSFLIELVQRKLEREKKMRTIQLSKTQHRSRGDEVNELITKKFHEIYNESYTVGWSQKKKSPTPINTSLSYVPRSPLLKNNNSIISQEKNFSNLPITIFEDNLCSLTLENHQNKDWEVNGIHSGLSREDYFKNKKNTKLKFVHGLISRAIRKEINNENDNIRNGNDNSNGVNDVNEGADDAFKRRVDFESVKNDKIQKEDKIDPMSEEAKMKREEEIKKYGVVINKLSDAIEKIDSKMETLKGSLKPLDDQYEKEKKLEEKLTKEYTLLAKTCSLYENKDENLMKLKKISSASAKKLIKMSAEWDKYRIPKIELIRKLKKQIANHKELYKIETEKIQNRKEDMKALINEIKEKQNNYKKLVEFYNNMEKEKDRGWYVQKILEIVRNIESQNQQIEKVLFENRDVKEKIITATNRAQQQYRDLEEKVFKNAKDKKKHISQFSKDLYAFLLEMHTLFENMVKNINMEGIYLGKIRDYDADIEDIKTRNDEDNTRKIAKDMRLIQKENVQLMNQLKKIQDKFSKF